jgi:hypothetical protein
MHNTKIEGLINNETQRPDFEQILSHRFPSLFIEISEGFNLHLLLMRSIQFICQNLTSLRPHMLDFRPFTVHQLLQVYSRVNANFSHILSSDTKQIS